MKSVVKIVNRYMGSAVLITLTVIFLNILVFGYCLSISGDRASHNLNTITKGFYMQDDAVLLDETSTVLLEDQYQFAFLLDEQGNIIWSHNLPTSLQKQYTVKDIASLSKWYLEDYPVWTWNCSEGLFIAGGQQNSMWKFTLEYTMLGMNRAIIAIPVCNIILIGLLCFLFGWRFYTSLKPVAQGIDDLSLQKQTRLSEKGILGDLKKEINQTAKMLEKQNNLLAKRDDARTEWIAGVSHDIRTPLSMVMGYADTLEKDSTLTDSQKETAGIIKTQSLIIRELIEDLNLTSKLEYQMQPLREEACNLSALLRQIVANYYNQNLDEKYEIILDIEEAAQSITIMADKELLVRAFRNLIGNSIRHNEMGCQITISVKAYNEHYSIMYQDTGVGIAKEVLQAFESTEKKDSHTPHIMGLYLVQRILLSHNGTFRLIDTNQKGMKAVLFL